jgi:hypothetical protein
MNSVDNVRGSPLDESIISTEDMILNDFRKGEDEMSTPRYESNIKGNK